VAAPGSSPARCWRPGWRWWRSSRTRREIDGPSLRGRLLTHSAFAVLDPGERERLIDSMVAVVTAEAQRQGTATVLLRQSAHCARWRRPRVSM
jgi:hypothetical protein